MEFIRLSDRVTRSLARVLMELIGQEAAVLRDSMSHSAVETPMQAENADVETREHHIESTIESDPQFSDTELQALIVARPVKVYSNSG